MSYKVTFTTEVATHTIFLKKDGVDKFSLTIGLKDGKVVSGSREKVLKEYKKFLTSIGKKSEYFDILTHLEITKDGYLESGKVFTYTGEE